MPDVDILYACDQKWWQHHLDNVRKTFKGRLITQYHNKDSEKFAKQHGLEAFEGTHGDGLGPDKMRFGSNSGCQAINVAYLLSIREWNIHPRIILLGYDMGNTGGKAHWFGNHPKGFTNGNYKGFVVRYDKLSDDARRLGVQIINCSRTTNLTQFPRATIDDYPDFHSV